MMQTNPFSPPLPSIFLGTSISVLAMAIATSLADNDSNASLNWKLLTGDQLMPHPFLEPEVRFSLSRGTDTYGPLTPLLASLIGRI